MKRTTCILTTIITLLPVLAACGEILRDDFANGDLTSPVTWETVRPKAEIGKSKDGRGLLLVMENGLVLSPAIDQVQDYTISFRGTVYWSSPGRFVFLYQDEKNYYSFGLGGRSRGIFRVCKGHKTKLQADPGGSIILPHKGDATAPYKVHIKRTDESLLIEIDKGGDNVDYDVRIVENDPELIAAFRNNRFGFACASGGRAAGFGDVRVVQGRLAVHRKRITYYVDAAGGDDNRTPQQAANPATPFKSITRAAKAASAGDTVKVAPGRYCEMIKLTRRGGFDAPITFKAADPQNRPVISGARTINPGGWNQALTTDFTGKKQTVFWSEITWLPKMLYLDNKPMMIAQEPNQKDARDPYNLKLFRKVPKQLSDHELKDPDFLVQQEKDYWKGATLVIWDSYPNVISTRPVTGYDPATHTLQIKPFRRPLIGNTPKQRPDLYALRNHLGLLDQPGEYYIDRSTKPNRIYVIPYPGRSPSSITATLHPHAFAFGKGSAYITINGFVISDCASNGIDLFSRNTHNIIIRNCKIIRNMNNGIAGRFVSDISIEKCLLRDNRDNGVSFGNCRKISILDTEITANGDNGVWFGGGQPAHWNSENILVKGCYLHHTTARRRHPDNYQMHQCRNVILENNIFLQEGEQNMWCQYSDNFILRNNIFIGGPLGINSVINNYIYHNIFWGSLIRYDHHLTNHPQNKDYYLPQKVVMRNNAFINSTIAWPSAKLLDRFKVFSIDHNYYHTGNANSRLRWEWQGYKLSLAADSMVITDQQVPAAGGRIRVNASVTWSNAAGLLLLYRDPENYYWLGIGRRGGLFRRMGGKEVCIFKDRKSRLRLPHKGGAEATFDISLKCTAGTGITFNIIRSFAGNEARVEITDSSPEAAGIFTTGAFGVSTPPKKAYWCSINSINITTGGQKLHDDFSDRDLARAAQPDEITWKVIKGKAAIRPLRGNGVGYGKGSIVVTHKKDLIKAFKRLPDQHGENFDFHHAVESPLIDAGIEVKVGNDLDNKPRPAGKAPDIGPYEMQPQGE